MDNNTSRSIKDKLIFLLSIFFLVNVAFGLTNLVIFYTFFVPGWAYPSLLIYVCLVSILVFFIAGYNQINYTYRTKEILRVSSEYLLLFIFFVLIFWFSINATKYYKVHLVLFITLFGLLNILAVRLYVFYLRKMVDTSHARPIIIVGDNAYSRQIASIIHSNKWYGLKVANIMSKEKFIEDKSINYAKEVYINTQLVPIDDTLLDYLKYLAEELLVEIKLFNEYFSSSINKNVASYIYNIPLINLFRYPLDRYINRLFKRVFDILISIIVVVTIFSWLFPIVAILIYIDNPGPIFYRQKRHGKMNQIFDCIKFRSMKVQGKDAFVQAKKNDDRITRVGAFIRKTSIDELPQFFNVLLGDMSVVGPRPHPIALNDDFSSKIDKYYSRHIYKPGITGLAQVKGYRGETDTLEKMQNRVRYDRYYIHNWSFLFDIKIMFMTFLNIIKGEKNAY